MSVDAGGDLDLATLRRVVHERCGYDPGLLAPETRLDDVGLSGLARWWLISLLEDAHGIEFPADLVTALETLDDLNYFVSVKLDQCSGEGRVGERR